MDAVVIEWKLGLRMCKVSITLLVHNASSTLNRCIESIIYQSYDDWELICCDDFSEDNSLSILLEWAQRDKRIKVLHNKRNRGIPYSRNKCVKESKGEYIAIIDDDDYCAQHRIKEQVNFLDKHKQYSFVGSKAYVFDEDGIWKTTSPKERPEAKDFLFTACFLNPSVMIRKTDMEEIEFYREIKETRRCEDYDLFMRMYSKGYIGYNMQVPLVYYYRGKNAYPKCKYKHRIDEAKIRYENFKKLELLPKYFFYVLKPLLLGAIPFEYIERMKKYWTRHYA